MTTCLILSQPGVVLADGEFVGDIVTKWEADGRSMTVLKSFKYIDADKKVWRVPSGVLVDGASIPQALWSLIGGPFEGRYRNASVVHDYFCDSRKRKWQDVHKVFYEAMLVSGVEKPRAYIMYKAVEKFGPRWPEPQVRRECLKPDGSFDVAKCTENDATPSGEASFPAVTPTAFQELIDEVAPVATAEDVEKLRQIHGSLPQE